MTEWKNLTKDEQVAALQQVAGQKHIPPQAAEKDLWVTTLLQVVFSLPFADKLVFKGGTSLSKVFGKIERFSEDIDLAVDRTLFGLEGDLTKKQLKKLRKASSTFVRDEFLHELQEALLRFGLEELKVTAEPDGEGDATYPEPRKLFIEYQSLFRESIDYIRPRVMLEIGACCCGCKRFRKVNPNGTDAAVKVKMLKNIRPRPAGLINFVKGEE